MTSTKFQALERLQPLFEKELRASLVAATEQHEPFGYALMLGEDLDLSAPIAVTCAEAEHPGESRYMPDEWEHWHGHHFAGFRTAYQNVWEQFASSHAVTDAASRYTSDAEQFMEQLYELYLTTMKSVVADFPRIRYWVIWIPDSDRGIIRRSVVELNSGTIAEEAARSL